MINKLYRTMNTDEHTVIFCTKQSNACVCASWEPQRETYTKECKKVCHPNIGLGETTSLHGEASGILAQIGGRHAALLTEDADVNLAGLTGVDEDRVNPAVTRPCVADHQISRLDVQQSAVCKSPFMVQQLQVIRSIIRPSFLQLFYPCSPI